MSKRRRFKQGKAYYPEWRAKQDKAKKEQTKLDEDYGVENPIRYREKKPR